MTIRSFTLKAIKSVAIKYSTVSTLV